MYELLRDLLGRWVTLMTASDAFALSDAWLAPLLLCVGVVTLLLAVKAFRPLFCLVAFFGATAGLMLALRPLLPWYAVVSIVATIGVFAGFVALFMKRVAIALMTGLGAAALVWLVVPHSIVAIVVGLAAIAASCLRPKESYVIVSALFGATLAVSAAPLVPGLGFLAAFEALLQGAPLAGVIAVFAAVGIAVQLLVARRGLDPVFTQVIDIEKLRDRRQAARERRTSAADTREAAAQATFQAASEEQQHPLGAAAALAASGASGAKEPSAPSRTPDETSCGGDRGERQTQHDGASSSVAAPVVAGVDVRELVERPDPFEPQFRKEIKYRIERVDFLRLKPMLDAYFAYDSYSGPEGYPVRSLYFDSLDDRDLYDKLDGTLEHKKIRMRAYDPLGDRFNVEYKCRWSQDGFKRKLVLNRSQALRLARNDYSVLLEFEPDPLARELYDRMLRGRYTPKVIVEYHRTAWEYPVSNIRVTWDCGIQASYFAEAFFEKRPMYVPIVPPSQGVLEVKYDYMFPSILKDALRSIDQLPVANSKYALGRAYL